jgi:hypothetical protein
MTFSLCFPKWYFLKGSFLALQFWEITKLGEYFMKFTNVVFLLGILIFSSFSLVKAQNQNDCLNGQKNGIYYTNCWADAADDTVRLQDAVDLARGKLIFNEENYEITNPIEIRYSNKILEGLSVNTSSIFNTTKITQKTSGKSLFFIGSNVYEISIRDLGLAGGNGTTGTIGILAQSTTSVGSAKFQFSNLKFYNFDKGIYVNSSNGQWQFDNVKLDHSTFEGNRIGIELNAQNSGWSMNNNVFYVPASTFCNSTSEQEENLKTYGIKIIRGAYISMNLMVGNGPVVGSGSQACTFIYIKEHSVLSIQNSANEGFATSLNLDGVDKNYSVSLVNNGFGKDVIIKNSTVVSSGNFYGYSLGISRPKISGFSDVYSIGDRFCLFGSVYCANSGFSIEGTSTLYKANVIDDSTNIANQNRSVTSIVTNLDDKNLLELGKEVTNGSGVITKYTYNLKRDLNGWLVFQGNQSSPYKGYSFDAPVKLPTKLFVDLSSLLSTAGDGAMVFCSNCQQNTSPCGSGTSGALAVVINGQWRCK